MKRTGRWAVCLMIALLFWIACPAGNAEDQIQAYFLNVGKADAILLRLNGQDYLVDTGSKESYDQMEDALRMLGVDRLAGVIITHTDKDHVGGLKKLLKSEIDVERVYAGKLHSEKSDEDHPAYSAAEKRNVPFTWLGAGEKIQVGECVMDILGPLSLDAEDENNNSLVLNVETPEGNFLLAGDMTQMEEEELLNAGVIPRAAVLKVGHHGRDDATGKALVAAVRPQWAVISTSSQERPDTPAAQVTETLKLFQVKTAVTQEAQVGILAELENQTATVWRVDWDGKHPLEK